MAGDLISREYSASRDSAIGETDDVPSEHLLVSLPVLRLSSVQKNRERFPLAAAKGSSTLSTNDPSRSTGAR